MSIEYISQTEFKSVVAPGVTYKLKKLSHKRRVAINLASSSIQAKIHSIRREFVDVNNEIERAEIAAKQEPCTCIHGKDDADPYIVLFRAKLEALNADNNDPVIPEDTCHNSRSRQCMISTCKCRRPAPNPEIGDYDKKDDILGRLIRATMDELYPVYIRECVSEIQGLVIDGKPATVETFLEDGPEGLASELGPEIEKLLNVSAEEALGFKSPTTSGTVVDGQTSGTAITAPSTVLSAKENKPTSVEYAAVPV